MSSRTTLQPQADKSRKALLQALRMPGDNTGLVALRTRRLLQWKPAQADLTAWLREVLPKLWHCEKAVAALQGRTVTPANGTIAVASDDDATSSAAAPGRRRRSKRT